MLSTYRLSNSSWKNIFSLSRYLQKLVKKYMCNQLRIWVSDVFFAIKKNTVTSKISYLILIVVYNNQLFRIIAARITSIRDLNFFLKWFMIYERYVCLMPSIYNKKYNKKLTTLVSISKNERNGDQYWSKNLNSDRFLMTLMII